MPVKVAGKHQFFTNQKCFIITGEHLAYLTAFFNSRIFRFAFKEYFPELLGDTRELSKVFFENVTVIPVSDDINEQFEMLVDEIVEKKKSGEATTELEMKIERKLASIYQLSGSDMSLINSREPVDLPAVERISVRSSAVRS